MAENSKIEWTDHTFNPWRGCTKVAEGCANCYADAQAKRNPGTLGIWGPNGTRVVASEAMWREPLKWNRTPLLRCNQCGQTTEGEPSRDGSFEGRGWEFQCSGCYCERYTLERPRVFCASLADVFEDWGRDVHDHKGRRLWIDRASDWMTPEPTEGDLSGMRPARMNDIRKKLFALIDATPNLDWLLLTKRPENIRKMMPDWEDHPCLTGDCPHGLQRECDAVAHERKYRQNLWLGTSIATQADADRNIPELLKCRDLAPVLFVSAEPLLGPIDLHLHDLVDGRQRSDFIRWVIAGYESGPKARPRHPDLARSLRDQCVSAGVPFFFKQWGEWLPGRFDVRKGKMICDRVGHVGDNADSSDTVGRIFWTNPGTPQVHLFDDCDHYWKYAAAKVGKKAAGRLLDGREWNEFPEVHHAGV